MFRYDFCNLEAKISHMPISEEDNKKFEHDFQYLVDQYITFFSQYSLLINKKNRSFEEEEEFLKVQQLLLSISSILSTTMQSLSDELFGKAIDLYYHYKLNANDGDMFAKQLVNDLKPLFAASLNSRIYKN